MHNVSVKNGIKLMLIFFYLKAGVVSYSKKNMYKTFIFSDIVIKFESGLGKAKCSGPIVFSS